MMELIKSDRLDDFWGKTKAPAKEKPVFVWPKSLHEFINGHPIEVTDDHWAICTEKERRDIIEVFSWG